MELELGVMELIDPDLVLPLPLLLFLSLNSAALFILGLVGELIGLLAIFVLLSHLNLILLFSLVLSSLVKVLLLTTGGLDGFCLFVGLMFPFALS